MTQGYKSSLSTTESTFYLLDTLPLFVAVAVYVPFWPGRFITAQSTKGDAMALQSLPPYESGSGHPSSANFLE